MLFHPILNQLANLDMAFLVKPADEQRIEGQTACFCPFCQKELADDGEQGRAKQTPHLIIYHGERGGLYDGVGVEGDRQAEHGAMRWMCTETGKYGYGALELYAAMRNLPMHGASLLRICKDLVVRIYGDKEEVCQKWPMIFGKMDYRTVAPQTIETFSFIPKTDFNPQELAALGCEVTMLKGIPQYGFGKDFTTQMLNDDFRIYAVDKVTLPNVVRDGQQVSEVIYGTPWNPLFVCFATDVIAPQGSCGCFFRPAMQQDPIVFSTAEEHTVRKVSKWLMGDKVFTYAMDHRSSTSTAVHSAITSLQPDEPYTKTKEVWVENETKDGEPKGTFHSELEPIDTGDIKAQNIVFCRTPEDALSVYYAMRALRQDKTADNHFQQYCWYHVAFSLGRRNFWYIERGQWKQEKLDFNAVQYMKMKRFAERVIMLYPNDIASQRDCGAICVKYSDLCYAMLPDGFKWRFSQRWQWLYGCTPRSIRDYLVTYCMTETDNFMYDHDIRMPLYSVLRTATDVDPFALEYPRDPRSGKPKPPVCKVSPTKVWLYMTCNGYYRMVDPDSTDKMGKFIYLEKCFVHYIDEKSIIQEVKRLLLKYIKEMGVRRTDSERKLMEDCANLVDKTFTMTSAGSLRPLNIDFTEGYDTHTEWFYFSNVALKITPESISAVSYDKINFFIPALARKDYDFTMQRFPAPPFLITESEEYKQRKQAIEAKDNMRNEDGSPVFSYAEIKQMKADLQEWAQLYRWDVRWKESKERDMWGILRVIRGCSNVLWQLEEETTRRKEELTADQWAVINSHFVNMISCIGRLCCRSWDGMQSICPYLLEDTIENEKEASGGSGKSVMIKLVVGSSVNVLNVNMKKFLTINDAKFSLTPLLKDPGKYRVVHWEDKPKSFPLKYFYNFVTSGTDVERKFGDPITLSVNESPLHVITSNSPLSDDDDSTVGRFPLVSFSDRFARDNQQKRKPPRSPSDVMKGFSPEPEKLSAADRNQAIYICALAVQFIMRYHTFAIAPQQNVRRRQMVQKLTESIVRYFEWFFSRGEVYAVPVCTDDMFNEFMRDWADASEGKSKEYSRATFKKKIYDYCENVGITCNPNHLFENAGDKQRRCFKLKTWVTQEYFVGKEWENDNTIEPKFIRYMKTSKHVFFFYRPGKDAIPENYEELKRIAHEYSERPDPLPYRDENGDIVQLSTEEQERWESNKTRRQGRRAANNNGNGSNGAAMVQDIPKNDLPF